jgi:NTE family protein
LPQSIFSLEMLRCNNYIAAMRSEQNVLVLQGGGALGAYQAGAYEALSTTGHEPEWIAGISIGAINAALIAGNKPENRLPRLRQLWNQLSSGFQGPLLLPDQQVRMAFNEFSSWMTMLWGVPGFFAPRTLPPLLAPHASEAAISFYDTAPLRQSLIQLVDFGLLNNGETRVSVGAVNVKTGNFKYFDTARERLTPDHIMASGALPPGLPPIHIGGEYYWDGGLVSNTPLQYVVESAKRERNLCIFQVDLFSARGSLPRSIMEVAEREKEIRYSSRTRMVTDTVQAGQNLRALIRKLLEKLPEDLRKGEEANLLAEAAHDNAITVMHLINRASEYDTQSKDYEFSRLSVDEHWANGKRDTAASLVTADWRNRKVPSQGMITYAHGHLLKDEKTVTTPIEDTAHEAR